MKTTFKNKRKAFTLIELLIVIAIIGILFIVLVSKVDFATDKAKAAGVQTDFRSFQVALETVARENAGFNTFGYDTGDTSDDALWYGKTTPDGQAYTYANKDKDAGDRVRNSYDVGDANLNGELESNETWTGRKFYTETWTSVYTFVKPGTTVYDVDVLADLEEAINKNLDPKLHISIDDNGIITMANQATDPWGNEYHGRYLSNAANDNLDRGVIIMYSNGANAANGSADGIQGGLVNITTPSHNVQGQDDYALAVMYTKVNGYGEIQSITKGFSNNQQFSDANHVLVTPVGEIPAVQVPGGAGGGGGGAGSLPPPNLNGAVANAVSPITYSWSELKALANANLSEAELRDTYGIEVGDYKEVNGIKYVLVDLDGNDYDGFVFMYNSGTTSMLNRTQTNKGGYVSTAIGKAYVDSLYTNLADAELKSAIKKVTITCNSGKFNADGTNDNGMSTYTTDAYMFLASSKEVGVTCSGHQYAAEGSVFDYFLEGTNTVRANFATLANISSNWWLRSAYSNSTAYFYAVYTSGYNSTYYAYYSYAVVPAFVIG